MTKEEILQALKSGHSVSCRMSLYLSPLSDGRCYMTCGDFTCCEDEGTIEEMVEFYCDDVEEHARIN